MRNRAKCKLCKIVIESFFDNDHVTCKCGEISVYGGTSNYYVSAVRDLSNILRVDDNDNVIIPKIITQNENTENNNEKIENQTSGPIIDNVNDMSNQISENENSSTQKSRARKNTAISEIDHILETIDRMPSHAMSNAITHYDYMTILILMKSLL